MKLVAVNIVALYIGWFACVLGAAYQYPLMGPCVVVGILALHFYLVADFPRTSEVQLILTVGLLGFLLDSAQASLGAFSFPGMAGTSWRSPLWMVALWMAFATTLHTSLRWLSGQYVLAAVLGVIGGPLSYYAGAQLGALQLSTDLSFSLSVIATAWGIAMPLMVWLATANTRHSAYTQNV
ncbi:MAG: DUF2878 domain-containing protein [Candidatus Binatia bacterium]